MPAKRRLQPFSLWFIYADPGGDGGTMIEPVELKYFFLSFFSAAMVILTGAMYALLLALGKKAAQVWIQTLGYAAYGLLVLFVFLLAYALKLSGFWLWVVAAMLIGYLIAPHVIWNLCVGTHTADEEQVITNEKKL